jgi:hypothetical protein
MEYFKIVESFTAEHLARQIEALLGAGWRPQGGVCVWWSGEKKLYAQALTK